MTTLVTIGFAAAIGAVLAAVIACARRSFREQLAAHVRLVRFVAAFVVPIALAGGATLGATGSLHTAWKAAFTATVASLLAAWFLRYVPRRTRSQPLAVEPDLDRAYRQHLRRS